MQPGTTILGHNWPIISQPGNLVQAFSVFFVKYRLVYVCLLQPNSIMKSLYEISFDEIFVYEECYEYPLEFWDTLDN